MDSMDSTGIHQSWLERGHVAAAFAVFALYAGVFALVGHGYDRTWAICAVCGYALAGAAIWRWGVSVRTLVIALAGAAVVPLLVFDAGPFTDGMVVIARSAVLMLNSGTPYVPDGQTVGYLSYDPYLPAMALFGLPKAAGLAGAFGNPALWLALVSSIIFGAAFWIAAPHSPRHCADCRREALLRAMFAIATPVIALNIAITTTDPPVLALMVLAMAFATRGASWRAAGVALGFACAMKATAWFEIPVLAALFWHRDYPRAAVRFVVTTVATAGSLIAIISPAALTSKVIAENTILFPLGLTHDRTPAGSLLPGHLLADSGPNGRFIATALLLAAGFIVLMSLILRPPRDVPAACVRLSIGLAAMFVFGPAERFGYFIYPLGLLGWAWLVQAGTDRERPNWWPGSVHQSRIARPAADSSAVTPSGRNLDDTSVRISSPSAKGTTKSIPGTRTV
jgi:hypothetical protein